MESTFYELRKSGVHPSSQLCVQRQSDKVETLCLFGYWVIMSSIYCIMFVVLKQYQIGISD